MTIITKGMGAILKKSLKGTGKKTIQKVWR